MYAIIETGGKQYRVTPGDVVNLERLTGDVGSTITFDKVLLIGGKNDSQVLVGTPYLTKAVLQAEIVDQEAKGDKIRIVKYRRRKGYRRTIGHRQMLTRVLVTKIDDGQGQSLAFDSAKRLEALRKASISTAAPKAKTETKRAAAPKADAPAKKATKTAGTTAKKTATKKA